jgi:hypothetical protein
VVLVAEMNNLQSIPKLLRAIAAGENAKEAKHDVILLEAAKLIERLEADLLECLSYFEDRFDVVDGDEGGQWPNKEMQLGCMIKETLYGPGNF